MSEGMSWNKARARLFGLGNDAYASLYDTAAIRAALSRVRELEQGLDDARVTVRNMDRHIALADELARRGDALLPVVVKYDRELWNDEGRTENRHIIEFRAALAAYRKGEA